MNERGYFDSLTKRVLGAVLRSPTLSVPDPRKVYQPLCSQNSALSGIRATAEVSFTVAYEGAPVGEYFADILVEDVLVRRRIEDAAFGR